MIELDILLPTLNSENTILKTLESINRAQNKYKNLKVVVLVSDGGSLDNTKSIVKNFNSNLDIRIVSECDSSPEEGLSKAFIASKGEYVMPIGADDFISQDYFQDLVDVGFLSNQILLPANFCILRKNIDGEMVLRQKRSPRKGLMLRYTIPLPGLGWIANTSKLKHFIGPRNQMLFTNKYKYATDNELFFDLRNSGFSYKTMKNNHSSYYFLEGGRSRANGTHLFKEACEIACKSSKWFTLDIKFIYFLWLLWIKVRK